MALIIGYCVWSMYRSVAAPDPQMVELTELLGSSAPILVDNMENTAWTSIGGRPNSATLIDKGGRVIAEQKWFSSEDIRRMIDKYLDK